MTSNYLFLLTLVLVSWPNLLAYLVTHPVPRIFHQDSLGFSYWQTICEEVAVHCHLTSRHSIKILIKGKLTGFWVYFPILSPFTQEISLPFKSYRQLDNSIKIETIFY